MPDRIAQPAPHLHLGGSGPLLHFSHANGYPPLAYRALLEPLLDSHQVIASLHRPLWEPAGNPADLASWSQLGDDLFALAAEQSSPLDSVGHSMGAAASVMAAVRRPELFRRLVLIEPVLMSQAYFHLLKLFRPLAGDRIPMIRRTLARTDSWASRADAFAHFRPKSVFAGIPDQVLWDYINHGTAEGADGGVRLVYSKQWEARCYVLAQSIWRLLPRLQVPVLAIRAEHSNTVSARLWSRWQRKTPRHRFVEISGAGHLVPFEQPQRLVTEIRDWLQSG